MKILGRAQRVLEQRNLMIGLTIMVVLGCFLVIVTLISPFNPNDQDLASRLAPPGPVHLLGTDSLGRDLAARLAAGGFTSLQVAVTAVVCGATIGVAIGVLAGYAGGFPDRVVMAMVGILMSFPALLLALLIASLLGAGLVSLIVAILATNVAIFTRVARGEVLRVKAEPYVEGAVAVGAGTLRILRVYILRNIWPPIIVATTMRLASAILVEATISYLGFGVPPPTATWGGIILEGQRILDQAIWVSVEAGALIMLTVLGLNLIGDGLRDVLDPRLRGSQHIPGTPGA